MYSRCKKNPHSPGISTWKSFPVLKKNFLRLFLEEYSISIFLTLSLQFSDLLLSFSQRQSPWWCSPPNPARGCDRKNCVWFRWSQVGPLNWVLQPGPLSVLSLSSVYLISSDKGKVAGGKGLTEKISRRGRLFLGDSRERICCGSHWSRKSSELLDRTRKSIHQRDCGLSLDLSALHAVIWSRGEDWCWELYWQIHLLHPLWQNFPWSVCTASATGCRCVS